MTHDHLLRMSERWFRLLLRLYPADFRDELGSDVIAVYRDQARDTVNRRGVPGLAWLWLRALADAIRNGPGERLRPAVSWRRSGNWGRDLGLARRRLLRSKVFVMATLGTLTVGLGSFAVVYTAVDKVLIARMPYREPDNLYFVWRDQSASGGLQRNSLAGPDVADLQNAHGVIEGAVGMQLSVPTLSVRADSEPLQTLMLLTSPHLFELLGVTPMLGRGFAANEVGPNRPPVIVLSHVLWTRLGGDPSIVGSQVWLSGSPYTVIGVMGPNFRFVRHSILGPPQEPDVYLPFGFHLADQDPLNPNLTTFAALVRSRAGTSPEQVSAAVDAVGRAVNERNHQAMPVKLYPIRLQDDLVAAVRRALMTLSLAAVVLILVLTVNLSSLLLARAAERDHEFAVSRALGANGSAVVRAMLLEGGLLGLMGGITGAVVGSWGARMLVAIAPLDLPRRNEIALDWRVAVVVIAVGLVLGIIAAAIPAAWALRASLSSLLTTSVRGAGGSQRLRRGIVVTQVALTLVLLSAGGLVARSFERLLATDPGFTPAGVLTFRVAMDPRLFPKAADAYAFQDRVEAALSALPGVRSVGATAALPLSAFGPQNSIWDWQEAVAIPSAPGNTGDAQRDSMLVRIIATRAGYAESMGVRILNGRTFARARPEGVQEAVIDQNLARHFFPTGTPIGAAIPFKGKTLRIIGVVQQPRLSNLHEDGRPQLFIRAEDWVRYMPVWVIKTDRDPQALAPEVRRAIREIDPRIPVSSLQTMDEIVTDALRPHRISAVLIGGFALGALLLVAMGLFGMISGSVVRRHGELAIRLTLGASHQRMLRLALGEGALLVVIGMLLAIPGVYATGGFMSSLLVEISPWDPLTLSIVALGLLFVTMAACYVPARRVLRIDPAPLLRRG
ncbi:MAG TPA: ADOP family duplicated permease [Vicinamibacterales bacterium]|nr:ADOP family duplicated permease [Vicinamibacterales bacterium]